MHAQPARPCQQSTERLSYNTQRRVTSFSAHVHSTPWYLQFAAISMLWISSSAPTRRFWHTFILIHSSRITDFLLFWIPKSATRCMKLDIQVLETRRLFVCCTLLSDIYKKCNAKNIFLLEMNTSIQRIKKRSWALEKRREKKKKFQHLAGLFSAKQDQCLSSWNMSSHCTLGADPRPD